MIHACRAMHLAHRCKRLLLTAMACEDVHDQPYGRPAYYKCGQVAANKTCLPALCSRTPYDRYFNGRINMDVIRQKVSCKNCAERLNSS